MNKQELEILLNSKKRNKISMMRAGARRKGKSVPSTMHIVRTIIMSKMICPGCGKVMKWFSEESRGDTLTLQHNHNGSVGVLCLCCNNQHESYPNDGFYTRDLNLSFCHACQRWLTLDLFSKVKSRYRGISSICLACSREACKEYHRKNKQAINSRKRNTYKSKVDNVYIINENR